MLLSSWDPVSPPSLSPQPLHLLTVLQGPGDYRAPIVCRPHLRAVASEVEGNIDGTGASGGRGHGPRSCFPPVNQPHKQEALSTEVAHEP